MIHMNLLRKLVFICLFLQLLYYFYSPFILFIYLHPKVYFHNPHIYVNISHANLTTSYLIFINIKTTYICSLF